MNALRFILVGLGARSRVWRQVIADNPRCTIVGLVDVDADRRAAALAQCPGAVAGDDLAEVAARASADAVILITPPGNRHTQIAAACDAGLAILAEKPLADSLAAARDHVAAAASAGIALSVGLNFRYLAVTRALCELFAEDRLGPPEFGHFTYERWRDGHLPHLNKYPLTMDQPMLWEQSIHHFDLMRHVYRADPVRISARTWNPSWSMYRHDANVAALITFERGIEVTYQGTWAGNWAQPRFEWRTDCRHGVAIQSDMFGALGHARRDDPELIPVDLPAHAAWIDDAAALLADFVAGLADGAPLPCPGEDHLTSLRMVEACIRAAATGQTLDLTTPAVAQEPAGTFANRSTTPKAERIAK
ncbi:MULTISPECIES: Gfo/Idh/MocA family oxidoreductase [unclassified Roseitalea]|uniref:Gfo/Idh/MocA family protein n=1 Tax=unclassified Roseitalea TaxID=2639107 RepID=UPI00273F69F6|nr:MULTISPECIES: Gfo/Idh/MocA family oxidoreductase [unclassified Roseitalea]